MDENFRHWDNMRFKREMADRAENLKVSIETARYNLAHSLQTRKENAAREDREEKQAHDARIAALKARSDQQVELTRGSNAESLATLQANLGLQTRIIGDGLDEIDHGRKLAEIGHGALADAFRAVVGAMAQNYADKRRSEREHGQALELENQRLENDLLRAQMAHEHAVGREEAQRQHDIFVAVLQSRLRNEEVTHAEIIRLIVRMTEGANFRANDRDAKKWASECLDEWEMERTRRLR